MKRSIVKKALPMVMAAFLAFVVGSASLLAAGAAPTATQRTSDASGAEVSMAIMMDEISQRVAGSPLVVFGMLMEALVDGSVAVDLTAPDILSGRVEMHSHMENEDFALIANVAIPLMGILTLDVDAAVLINNDRIAIGSSLLGDAFYGLDLTGDVIEDLRPLLQMMGMSSRDIRDLTEMLELFEMSMEVPEVDVDLFMPYIAFLESFMDSIPTEVTQVSGATRTTYTVTAVELAQFFGDFANMLENDRAMRGFLDIIFSEQDAHFNLSHNRMIDLLEEHNRLIEGREDLIADYLSNLEQLQILADNPQRTTYDMMVYALRDAAEELQRAASPTNNESYVMNVTLDTAPSGRINRFVFDYAAVEYRSRWCRETRTTYFAYMENFFALTVDFGNSVTDRWVITIQEEDQNFGESIVRFYWDYTVSGTSHTNRFTVAPTNPYSWPVVLFSQWDTATGAFTLGFEETDRRSGIVSTESFSGNLRTNPDNTFVLTLPEMGGVSVVISTEMGANIPAVTSFVNISELDFLEIFGMLDAFLQ